MEICKRQQEIHGGKIVVRVKELLSYIPPLQAKKNKKLEGREPIDLITQWCKHFHYDATKLLQDEYILFQVNDKNIYKQMYQATCGRAYA